MRIFLIAALLVACGPRSEKVPEPEPPGLVCETHGACGEELPWVIDFCNPEGLPARQAAQKWRLWTVTGCDVQPGDQCQAAEFQGAPAWCCWEPKDCE